MVKKSTAYQPFGKSVIHRKEIRFLTNPSNCPLKYFNRTGNSQIFAILSVFSLARAASRWSESSDSNADGDSGGASPVILAREVD